MLLGTSSGATWSGPEVGRLTTARGATYFGTLVPTWGVSSLSHRAYFGQRPLRGTAAHLGGKCTTTTGDSKEAKIASRQARLEENTAAGS